MNRKKNAGYGMKQVHILPILCAVLLITIPAILFAGGKKEKEEEPVKTEEAAAPAEKASEYGGRMTIGCTVPLDTLSLDVGSMYGNWGCLYYLLVYDNLERFNKPPDYY